MTASGTGGSDLVRTIRHDDRICGACSGTGRPGRLAVRSLPDLDDRVVLQMGRLEREELRVALLNAKNVVLVETVYESNVS